MWKVTFCQQAGTLKKRNQDALFNGERVYQYVLKKSETIEIEKENLIIGISDVCLTALALSLQAVILWKNCKFVTISIPNG
ncbi:hypothetical protein [Pasteurella multocida]|uniref:hypothetical protein n=1 Tax=Pasteurella multocida TaxID=747 RepID=UPI00202163FC|nr:hypothetical protein [Pasteurella multocida]MCL7818407.1 hypothetical protein [Pasteurella multocida]MEB3458412.1 hypothetical protein [Pasteurella multocida]MEB3487989.1 hypothetical protein [Pasteurella multocida]MEB3490502.1 hypothetical protein [Pasteurella multocida]WRK08191.1 hypothetical protein RFF38_05100 [Pasteurella multocida]